MSILVISAYFIGWIWLKVTTLPALIGMLFTGILFQNLNLVHMTDEYRKLNQDLRFVSTTLSNQIFYIQNLVTNPKMINLYFQKDSFSHNLNKSWIRSRCYSNEEALCCCASIRSPTMAG